MTKIYISPKPSINKNSKPPINKNSNNFNAGISELSEFIKITNSLGYGAIIKPSKTER